MPSIEIEGYSRQLPHNMLRVNIFVFLSLYYIVKFLPFEL